MASQSRNPNNAESILFKALTRLLSGPVTQYRRQNPRQLKRQQLDKFKFKSASGQPFKKSSSSPLQHIYQQARANHNRNERYIEFDQMEYNPLISTALDIYAGEMTVSSQLQKLLTINCPNEEIKGVLDHLYYDILNVEFNLFSWCRQLVKAGDYFLYLDIDEKLGIKSFIGLPPMEVERLEGEDKTNPTYVQFQWNSAGLTLENWQVAHFRILGNEKFYPYGMSILDPCRRIFRQLTLQEDAMMAYRVTRSSERRVWYVDVGGIPEKDIPNYMEEVMKTMKKSQIVDPSTGQIDQRYNPTSIEDDYYIATVGQNSGTKVETLPGGAYPIRQDSDIPLLDGRTITIAELAKEYDEGKENWVYSIQDKTHQIVPGKVIWCGKNYTCKNIYRIWLDDNSYIDMAPEHPVILRDGTIKRADELNENDSLMPFYFELEMDSVKEKLKGYPTVINPFNNKKEFVHRLIANSLGGKEIALERSKEKTGVIHHIDFNKQNNRPDNLKWMGFWEHRDFHTTDKTIARKTLLKYLLSPQHKENVKNRIKDPNDNLHKWIYSEENKRRLVQINTSPEGQKRRVEQNIKRWQNEEFRKAHSGKNHLLRKKWDKLYAQHSLIDLQNFCKSRNLMYMKDFISNDDAFFKTKTQCWKFLKFHGINSWKEFRQKYLDIPINHKVSKIEILNDIDDVYCMTVVGPNNEQDRHNFAVCGKTNNINNGKLSGIFVKNTSDIDDVKYLRDNMLAALKIPHAYLVSTGEAVEDKTTLAQKDIEFARTIQRLQRCVISELEKIGLIHLYVLGYRGKDLLSFKLRLNNPSKIAELQELEHWKTKFEVAAAATEGYFSKRWVAKNILDMSDETFLQNLREQFYDAKHQMEIEQITSMASGELEGGDAGLGDLGGDAGGGEEENDSALLAAPGKRHDEPYLTPGSKGKWYTREKVDKRPSGARTRHMHSLYSKETGVATPRNIFKGKSELQSLARGIYEELLANYQEEIDQQQEQTILQTDKDVKIVLEQLDNKFKKDN